MPPTRPDQRRFVDLPVHTSWRQTDKDNQVQSIMDEHAYGVFQRSAALVDEVMSDDHVMGVMGQRVSGLRAAPLLFEPAGERRKQLKVAEQLGGVDRQSGMWRHIISPPVQSHLQKWGLMLGLGIAEICWRREARAWTPFLRPWHPQFARWDWTLRRFVLQTMNGLVWLPRPDEEPRGDGKWFVWCPFGVEYGWMNALIWAMPRKYVARNWTERDWDRFNERHGQPIIKAMVPPGEGTPERNESDADFHSALVNMGQEPVVTCIAGTPDSPGYDISLLETQGRNWESFQARKQGLETDLAILVLGQNLSSKVQEGSRAATQVHDYIRLDKALEDAEIGPAFREQILTWWCLYNFGDAELAPWPTYQVMPAEDENSEALTLKTLGEALLALSVASDRVDVDAILESKGVPMYTEDEVAAMEAEEEEASKEKEPPPGGGDAPPEAGDDGEGDGDGQEDSNKGEKEDKSDPEEKTEAKAFSLIAHLSAKNELDETKLRWLEQMFGEDLMKRALDRYREREEEKGRAKKNLPAGVVKRYKFQGLPIAVENPAGTIRMWTDLDGKQGATKMRFDYGFIEGAKSGDGEDLDCYIGPDATSTEVYVVAQLKAPAFKYWDEDKVLLGMPSADFAKQAYLAHRSDERAWGGMRAIPLERFKASLRRRDPESTSKIKASQDLARALTALARSIRSPARPRILSGKVALKRTVAGAKRAARYEEKIIERSTALASRAMAGNNQELWEEIQAGGSLEDVRRRLVKRFPGLDLGKLQTVFARAAVLARVHGDHSAREQA